MATSRSELAAALKDRLATEEVIRFYGFEPNRSGFLRCPFHAGDRTASLKVYHDGWHCFGCGKGGSVIDFVMELYGLTFRQACLRLNADFGLGIVSGGASADQRAIQEAREKAREIEEQKAREEAEESALLAEHRYWWEVRQVFEPADGYIHPLYEQAVKMLPVLGYMLDYCADRRWRRSESLRAKEGGPTRKKTS